MVMTPSKNSFFSRIRWVSKKFKSVVGQKLMIYVGEERMRVTEKGKEEDLGKKLEKMEILKVNIKAQAKESYVNANRHTDGQNCHREMRGRIENKQDALG